MKKMFSIIVLMGLLCTLTAFTVGCGDAPKKTSPAAPATSPTAKTTTAS